MIPNVKASLVRPTTAQTSLLVKLIYLYFWLLIGEGILRKWIFPSWSGPLLIIRDPVMIGILFFAAKDQVLSPVIAFLFVLTGLVFWIQGMLQMLSLSLPFFVIGYGWRTYLLHLPLPFIMAAVLTRESFTKIARWTCYCGILMVPLVVWQFVEAPSHWVNVAAGGEGQQMPTAFDKIRAAGTFSFSLGLTFFYCLCFAIALANEIEPLLPKKLTRIAVCGTLLVVAISGSRSSVAAHAMVFLAYLLVSIVGFRRQTKGWQALLLMISAVVAMALLVPIFMEGLLVLENRFSSGGEAEVGLFGGSSDVAAKLSFLQRLWDSMVEGIDLIGSTPVLGKGFGVGTNAGSQLLVGSMEFLLAETEWARIILEAGPITGGLYILFRVSLAWYLFRLGLRALHHHNAIPLLLVGANIGNLVFGQWGPPSNMGFAMFVAGLTMARFNKKAPHSAGRPVSASFKNMRIHTVANPTR